MQSRALERGQGLLRPGYPLPMQSRALERGQSLLRPGYYLPNAAATVWMSPPWKTNNGTLEAFNGCANTATPACRPLSEPPFDPYGTMKLPDESIVIPPASEAAAPLMVGGGT